MAGSGYGSFLFNRKAVSAHRFAYRLATGAWPDGKLIIRHKCDNPACVNPAHLETGTHTDNMLDWIERGPYMPKEQAGAKNYNAKLTAADVELMREFIKLGWTDKGLAKRFGVTVANVNSIRHGKSWRTK